MTLWRAVPQVQELKDLQGPFQVGSVVEVGCAVGWQAVNVSETRLSLRGSLCSCEERNWTVKCVGLGAWSALSHYGGCRIMTCSALSDLWGTWKGGLRFKEQQLLSCAKGFNVEGARELLCLASGLWSQPPGRCLPNGGNPELWRPR